MKDCYKDETLYILSCGPSLSEYDKTSLSSFLSDKPTFAIKQAYDSFSDVTDFHFFNCSNLPNPVAQPVLRHYKYDEDKRPIIISSSNYELGRRWHKAQKQDIFFKIPIYGGLFDYKWRPLTKDPAATLLRKHTLYDLLVKFRPIE